MEGVRWAGMTSNQKGAIAEAEFYCAAVWAGVPVSRPMSEHGRADLILELEGSLRRIQCKWGNLSKGAVSVRIGTCRLTPQGYVRTTYGADQVDAFGIYCAALDRCYLLPISEAARQIQVHLRVDPAKNNQHVGLKYAAQFEFPGAIAQLGERQSGTLEAAGSSPASSTRLRLEK
jgi:hypothetical protein